MLSTLGVNVDHVATVREARKGVEPEVVAAVLAAERAGAFGITVHLRQDRRHIQDRDVALLKQVVSTKLNFEMSIHPEIVDIACATLPEQATLVPENRREVTTEGGLDVKKYRDKVEAVTGKLKEKGIIVSLFIDPEMEQIELTSQVGADYIEIHTGRYAESRGEEQKTEFIKIVKAAAYARELGLGVNAGHGLNYVNLLPIARIPEIEELNIGHSIISRAIFSGLHKAVSEMAEIIHSAGEGRDWPY